MQDANFGSHDISWHAELLPHYARVLSPEAIGFISGLIRRFAHRFSDRRAARAIRQAAFDAGERPNFPRYTRELRASPWTVPSPPNELSDRRVELTGPIDRKTLLEGLNARASAFIADFEDASTPTFANLVEGQMNLFDAVRGTLRFDAPDGKRHELARQPSALMVQPRGLHLDEKHLRVDRAEAPAALFDVGLHVFHNARALRERGSGVYLYLPKLESFLEARLWNDVFEYCERTLDLPLGTIRAAASIETLPAAFEMDEILFELRRHSLGLHFGRCNFIFSYIKKLRSDPRAVLPDRAQLSLDGGVLLAATRLLVRTCHRRGAHAIGGMAARAPLDLDPGAHDAALQRVQADMTREVTLGHDGTRVTHPALVPVARAVFDRHMRAPNQLRRMPEFSPLMPTDLLAVPGGDATESGLCNALRVGVAYLEGWLRGKGSVSLDGMLEDAATAEIARAQLWQWIRHGVALDNGRVVTRSYVRAHLPVEAQRLVSQRTTAGGPPHLFATACELFESLVCAEEFTEFLTLPAYEALLARGL
jgi:malate synthase